MKCIYKGIKNGRLKACNKECTYKYCFAHWKLLHGKQIKKFTIVGTIIGLLFLGYDRIETIKKVFQSNHEEFIEKNYIPGFIYSPSADNQIHISSGGAINFTAPITNNSINIDKQLMLGCTNSTGSNDLRKEHSFSIKVENGVLLMSFIIKDLKTEKIIGKMYDNHWLIKNDITDYSGDDHKSFEIIDNYGYPVFSLWVDSSNTVQYRGYFIGDLCVYFSDGNAIEFVYKGEPNYMQKCIEHAGKLKPHFVKINQ